MNKNEQENKPFDWPWGCVFRLSSIEVQKAQNSLIIFSVEGVDNYESALKEGQRILILDQKAKRSDSGKAIYLFSDKPVMLLGEEEKLIDIYAPKAPYMVPEGIGIALRVTHGATALAKPIVVDLQLWRTALYKGVERICTGHFYKTEMFQFPCFHTDDK